MQQRKTTAMRAVRWSSALLSMFVVAGALAAQTSPAFELRRGVIVEEARAAAYVAEPAGGVEAIDLASGRVLWESDAAALPLASNGRLLVAQAEQVPVSSRLRLVVYEADGGRKLLERSIDLPDDVRTHIIDRLGRRFRVSAAPEGDGFLITWSYREVPMLSSARPPGERLPQRTLEGTLRLMPATGELLAIDDAPFALRTNVDGAAQQVMRANALPQVPLRAGSVLASVEGGRGGPLKLRRWNAMTGEALPERQLAREAVVALPSSDSDHVIASERVGEGGPDDPEYRWSIFSLESGERVGELRRDVSASPFLIWNGNVVFESQPHGYRRGEAMVKEPMSVRAVRVSTGVPVWTREIRDLEYRGPVPPAR